METPTEEQEQSEGGDIYGEKQSKSFVEDGEWEDINEESGDQEAKEGLPGDIDKSTLMKLLKRTQRVFNKWLLTEVPMCEDDIVLHPPEKSPGSGLWRRPITYNRYVATLERTEYYLQNEEGRIMLRHIWKCDKSGEITYHQVFWMAESNWKMFRWGVYFHDEEPTIPPKLHWLSKWLGQVKYIGQLALKGEPIPQDILEEAKNMERRC